MRKFSGKLKAFYGKYKENTNRKDVINQNTTHYAYHLTAEERNYDSAIAEYCLKLSIFEYARTFALMWL